MISVIVPFYNRENTISKCLLSIIHQTYSDLEIILVDDGSTDNGYIYCEEIQKKDKRIQLIRIKNRGVSAARNLGITVSSGKYILFVDSDDYIPMDYCEQLIKNVNENVMVIASLANHKNGKLVNVWNYSDNEEISSLSYHDILKIFDRNLLHSPTNKLYDSKIIKERNLSFSTDINLGEDLLFNIEYIKSSEISEYKILNNILYIYQHDDTNSLSLKYNENYFIIQKLLFNSMHELIKNVIVNDSDWEIYFQWYWSACYLALKENMKISNPISFWSKIQKNHKIICDKDFRKILKSRKGKISRLIYISLCLRSYLLYLFSNYIVNKRSFEGASK